MRTRAILASALGLVIMGCASARPEQKMEATSETGHLVPLDSVTTSFDVGGVRVIYRPNYANDVVAVNLYLLGGTRQLTTATQGIESLLLHASEYGTAHYPGDEARKAWARTGSMLDIGADDDWTRFGFRGIRQEFDSSWNVFADRLMHPTLAAANVALVRERLIGRIRQQKNDPDGYITLLGDSAAFAGHPYGLAADGTEQSLAGLDSAALARYESTQMVTSRMLLVVVGNVSRTQVEAAVSRTLASLPRGRYTWTLPPPAPDTASSLLMMRRPASTNYILGLFEGPPASAADYAAFRVATELLASRMNRAIREERGLSYAATALFMERGVSTGAIYVTTGAPAKVMPIIRLQIDWLQRIPPQLIRMDYVAEQFILDYYVKNLTNDAQADVLARAQLYRGDYHEATREMQALREVNVSRVRAAAEKYLRNIHFVYLGDTTLVKRSEFAGF